MCDWRQQVYGWTLCRAYVIIFILLIFFRGSQVQSKAQNVLLKKKNLTALFCVFCVPIHVIDIVLYSE